MSVDGEGGSTHIERVLAHVHGLACNHVPADTRFGKRQHSWAAGNQFMATHHTSASHEQGLTAVARCRLPVVLLSLLSVPLF